MPVGTRNLFTSPNLPDRHRDHLVSLLNWYRRTFLSVKRLRREANHLPPSSAKVKN